MTGILEALTIVNGLSRSISGIANTIKSATEASRDLIPDELESVRAVRDQANVDFETELARRESTPATDGGG